MGSESQITATWYWTLAGVMGLADVVFLYALARVVPRTLFAKIRWPLALAVGACWTVLWAAIWWGSAWRESYGLLFPGWVRWLGPFLYAGISAVLSFAFWRLAMAFPGSPVVTFCLLGGLSSVPSNAWLVYRLEMLERVPLMRGVSAASTFAQGFAEFTLYWCISVSISLLFLRAILHFLATPPPAKK
jgi:hypothetical protein